MDKYLRRKLETNWKLPEKLCVPVPFSTYCFSRNLFKNFNFHNTEYYILYPWSKYFVVHFDTDSELCKYLDSLAVFAVLSLCSGILDLKWSDGDDVVVQTICQL